MNTSSNSESKDEIINEFKQNVSKAFEEINEKLSKLNPPLCINSITMNNGTVSDIKTIEKGKETIESVTEPISDFNLPVDSSVMTSSEMPSKEMHGGNMLSDTSSINGSFLNNRMNKYLRNSMLGGGTSVNNSDTLASITELQRMPSYKSGNSQKGGNLSKSDFMKKMRDAGVTSTSTSDFCG